MADNAGPLPDRGKTWFDGATPPTSYLETVDLEGKVRQFDDTDPTSGVASAQTRRSGRQVVCRLVRNVSGITLAKSRLVQYQATNIGKRVDSYVITDYARAAGVVDDHYTTGIANNDLGWIVVQGPVLVLSSIDETETNISQGDDLVSLTAVTSQSTTAGRIVSYVVTSNQTFGVSGAMNRIGQALSARTTAHTNSGCLVDVEIVKGIV